MLKHQAYKPLLLQLIQTANLLVHNLSSQSSLRRNYVGYLIHTDFYEEVLVHPFDFTDLDLIESYASLIKSLSVNLPQPFELK